MNFVFQFADYMKVSSMCSTKYFSPNSACTMGFSIGVIGSGGDTTDSGSGWDSGWDPKKETHGIARIPVMAGILAGIPKGEFTDFKKEIRNSTGI